MSTPPQPPRRKSSEDKKGQAAAPDSDRVVTRNGARKAKIQTRAMVAGSKPSASLQAAKKKAQQRKKQFDIIIKDSYQNARDSMNSLRGKTGIVTDPKMLEHECSWDSNYPECPARLSRILERCDKLALLERCERLNVRKITIEEINSVHSPSVHDMLQKTDNSADVVHLEKLSSQYDAVYIHSSSHEASLLAAGATVELVDAVIAGTIQNGFALIRPPGHHAMKAEPCGYCFYNNVAIAAQRALDVHGLKRILIVDWDVHHGQATQQMFYDDPRVVYFSVHRYEHGSFWPSLKQSNFNYIGCSAGTGYNFNVPLNKTQMQDSDYLAIWNQLLLPMALEYRPQLIIVSAGYDAALGCIEGQMELSPACYAHLLHLLEGVCSSLAVVLEGGYCLRSLSEGAALTLRNLLGDPVPKIQPLTEPSDSIRDSILNCIYAHKSYWNCFNYQQTYNLDPEVKNICDGAKEKHIVEVKWLGDEFRPENFPTRDCYPLQSKKVIANFDKRLNQLEIVTDLKTPEHKVSYVYDEDMMEHRCLYEPEHLESPFRIQHINERHIEFNLLERVHRIKTRHATPDEIVAVHTEPHFKFLTELETATIRELHTQQYAYNSIYFHPKSFDSACIAAGCCLEMVDTILNGMSSSGVCVVRPPGHHASEDIPSGFCLLNNVAIAARYATDIHGLKRVLILDWDVHHGNGTQDIFRDDSRVLYVSVHRYDDGSFFPNSSEGNYDFVGSGPGKGFNVNIPWNRRGMGDVEYFAAFTQVVLPIAYEFNPELVIISAGFDACIGDPLGGCRVSPEAYGQFTHWLRGLAGGRVMICLEGGYNLTSISYAMTMCTKALLGDPLFHGYDRKIPPHPTAIESINNVINTHKKYWKHLKFQLALPKENVLSELEPSRGLIISDTVKIRMSDSDFDRTDDSGFSNFDSSIERNSSLNDSEKINETTVSKCNDSMQEILKCQLEDSLNKLSIADKCVDGVHCGSDDESNSKPKDKSQTLVDYLSANMEALANEEMFAVVPLNWCPHLESMFVIPPNQTFAQGSKCNACDHLQENWICLHCYMVACGRHINAHMLEHYQSTQHALVLSLADLSVWCNVCEAYVDHSLLYDAKNLAHQSKFGEEMPWSYGERSDTLHLTR